MADTGDGMKQGATGGTVTALYHGACPICGTEIRHYRRYAEDRAIRLGWEDISTGVDAPLLDALGLDREDAKRRMTVLDADGQVHRGVDAFLVLWREMPRYRRLADFIALPGVYHLARIVYDRLLAPALYAWNHRRGR